MKLRLAGSSPSCLLHLLEAGLQGMLFNVQPGMFCGSSEWGYHFSAPGNQLSPVSLESHRKVLQADAPLREIGAARPGNLGQVCSNFSRRWAD